MLAAPVPLKSVWSRKVSAVPLRHREGPNVSSYLVMSYADFDITLLYVARPATTTGMRAPPERLAVDVAHVEGSL